METTTILGDEDNFKLLQDSCKMSDQDLKNAILRLTELVVNQQEQIQLLKRTGQASQPGSEKIIESLATGIEDFYYDPDGGVFFDAWFARYEDVFKVDGKNLDDPAKVRLLLRKIGTQFHERYVNSSQDIPAILAWTKR